MKKKSAKKSYVISVKLTKTAQRSLTTEGVIALAFDEWMRRYEANPQAFQAEFQAIADLKRKKRGAVASAYGTGAAAYLLKLVDDVTTGVVRRGIRTKAARK
jgi:hypothetical protein